ncbi:MAG: transfer Agent [Ancylobacter novellus]|uniref:Transfer Agent n=1 Tax=Ancylobacter novellus TaxID=921 RepID=A0A2W5KM82_ANCNO|nr:MAG: transfer Agent [Ancylobacter novellus]
MPANLRRGEVAAVFDGTPRRLVLTLGALAELEAAFAVSDLTALAERFETGRLSARDLVTIVGAGLRGGGAEIDDAAVARLAHEDGAAGFVRVVADLLRAAFGGGGEGGAAAQNPLDGRRSPGTTSSPSASGR